MYCPKCGNQNEGSQQYCRQCGQSLSAVSLALDGSLEESIATLKQGQNSLNGGVVTFGIFLFISIIVYLFGGAWAASIDILLGLIISIPMIVKGILKLEKVEKQLQGTATKSIEIAGQSGKNLGAGNTTDELELPLKTEYSVTEEPTLRLRIPESEK